MPNQIEFDAIIRVIGKTKYIAVPKEFPPKQGKSVRVIITELVPDIVKETR